jgi:hypothetical protein
MPKYKVGYTQSVPYKNEIYEVTSDEYLRLEDELEWLDRYSFTDTENATEWIIYRFLKSLDYQVDEPNCPEPLPCDDLFDTSASEGAAEEVKGKLYEESQNFQTVKNHDAFAEYLRHLPSRRSQKINRNSTNNKSKSFEKIKHDADVKRGGEICMGILIVIFLILISISKGACII